MMLPSQGTKGFTLLELLLAMGVSALIAVLAYLSISGALTANSGLHREVLLMSELQRALDIIEMDIGNMLARRNQTLQGSTEPVLLGGNTHDPLLQFSRGAVENPAGLQRSDMQRLRYVLSDKRLWRQHRWQLDGADPNQLPESTLLLEQVQSIRLEFMPRLPKGTLSAIDSVAMPDLLPWVEVWDSEHLQAGQTHPLPLALRLTIDVEGFGSVQRILGIP
jgi:general secretion pathway protein J